MTFSLKKSLLFIIVLLRTFLPSVLGDLPGDDMPNQTTSSCTTDANCLTYYHAKCVSGSCTDCSSASQCTRFYSPGSCSSGECIIPCTSSNQDICRTKRTRCDSGRCQQCFSDSDCTGYPGANVYCLYHSTEINLCVNCKTNSNCPTGMTCQNYKCIQCTSDGDCSGGTPYCLKKFEENVCKQCLQNSHCTSASSSKCSTSNSCTGCSVAGDCSHIPGKPACSSGTCVECAADSDCPDPTKAYCNMGSKTCAPCTSHTPCSHLTPNTYCYSGTCINAECITISECTNPLKSSCNTGTKFCEICTAGSTQCSHISATPLCAGSPNGCVQCLVSTDCTTAAASACNAAGSCQRCSINTDCNNISLKPICDTSVGCVECITNPTCTSITKSWCNSNTCQLCTGDPHCSHLTATPVCSNTAAGCVECKIDSSCTNALKSHCNSGYTCEVCSSNGHCTHLTTTKVCSNSVLGCVECMASSDCQDPTKSFCDISLHTCKKCSGDSECSHLSLTPYCSSTKCTECLTNPHCTNIAKSYCNPATYTCQVCTISNQCTHLTATPFCSTSDSRCAECLVTTDCTNPAKSNCVSGSKTCQLCTTDPQCSHLSATPRCSGTSFGCVECMSNSECPTKTKSYCYPSLHVCQSCAIDSHCSHIPNVNKCWYGECVIYSPVCIPSYTVTITQEKTLNDFVVDFDPDLVTKISILSTIKIQLIDVDKTDYTYTVSKVTETQFNVNFQVKKSIPKTKIEVKVPCPTQPGYVYGNITKEANTKKIPYGSDDLKAAMDALGNMAATATAAVGGISSAMMFLGGNPAILWGLIGLLQTFYYMIFINVQYPANVQAFFPIFALGNLEFIPNPMWIIFPNIDDFSLPVPTKFAEHEVDGLFLANAGNMLLLWIGNIALYFVSALIMRYTRNMPKVIATVCTKVVETFEWSGTIRVFITSYMELTIAAFLQLRVLSWSSGLFSASSVCGLIFGTFGLLLPMLAYKIVQRYDTKPKLIKHKFGTLIEEYKLNDDIHKYFTVISIGRNLILAASLVYLHDYPYIEIITLTTLRFSSAYLLIKYRPYDNTVTNISNFISELVFGVVHIFIFILIHDDYSPSFLDEQRMNIGWGIIGGCGIILMASMIQAISEQISVIRKILGLLLQVLKGEQKSRQKRMKKLNQSIKKVHRKANQVTDESLMNLKQSHENSFPTMQILSLENPQQMKIKRPVHITTNRRRKIKRP